jgi:two-component system chemotaxis response regulator CheY
MKFLIVDDSRIMRSIIKNSIDRGKLSINEEIEFEEAFNGLEALQILEQKPIDFLLLDWNMPFLDGIGLVKKVRQNSRLKDLPIIMITAEAAKYNYIEAIKEGVNDYIIKPVDEEILLKKINKQLAKRE